MKPSEPLKNKRMKKIQVLIFTIAIVFFIVGCEKEKMSMKKDLKELPPDTGGVYEPVYLKYSNTEYGYFVYTPSDYEQNPFEYPLLVFLHGAGEKGNSSSDTSALNKVLNTGIPQMIKNKKWAPEYPMIVVMPQCHDGGWNAQKVHAFIGYIITQFRVNEQRIYLTGLSMGGYGTFNYLQSYGQTYIAAAVPICGGGNLNHAERLAGIPLWAFHGDADNTVLPSNSINMIEKINSFNPLIRAKLTIYPGVGHNSWSMTYNGTGMGKESQEYDPFNQSIYNWMFGYKNEN
jgi:predicted peptidase